MASPGSKFSRSRRDTDAWDSVDQRFAPANQNPVISEETINRIRKENLKRIAEFNKEKQ